MPNGVGHNGGPPISQDSGWVAIARAMRNHPLVGFHLHATPADANRGATQPALAWIDLIMECRYLPGAVNNNGKIMRLERGQLVGATSWLAARWNWTPKAVRVWLDKLEVQRMISFAGEINQGSPQNQGETEHDRSNGRSKGRFANVITICNYSKFQLSQQAMGQVDGQDEGQINGRLGAGWGQVEGRLPAIYPRARETKEQGNQETNLTGSPLPPAAEDGPKADQPSLFAGQTDMARLKHERAVEAGHKAAKARVMRAEEDDALAAYNAAAFDHGFTPLAIEHLSDQKRKRLRRRLDDIGGLDQFKRALVGIPNDNFIAGRVPGRDGQPPFRLDFDRLLSTNSKLDDVLVRLISKVDNPDAMSGAAPAVKQWGWWRSELDKWKVLDADYWRRQLIKLKPNGEWPWQELGAPPGHEEAIIHPDVVAEFRLDEKYRGRVNAHQG